MQEIENKPERALLVAVDTGEYDTQASLAELYELTRSAGADPAGSVVQKRPRVEAGTCVGTGMLQEISDFCQKEEIDLLIFDRELSPTQIRNIEEATDVRVIDRTQLILDIFAQRARSREGRLQVELAQLRYLLPRLTGRGAAMSRLGGGIGTRGPGESKLETDRRHIRRRIEGLREQLEEVEKHRTLLQNRRRKKRYRDSGTGGIHQCGQEYADEPADPSRGVGGKQIVCHPGPHCPGTHFAGGRRGDADRHGRAGAASAPPAGRCVPLDPGRSGGGRYHPECVRRFQPGSPGTPGCDAAAAGGTGGATKKRSSP